MLQIVAKQTLESENNVPADLVMHNTLCAVHALLSKCQNLTLHPGEVMPKL